MTRLTPIGVFSSQLFQKQPILSNPPADLDLPKAKAASKARPKVREVEQVLGGINVRPPSNAGPGGPGDAFSDRH